MSQKRGYARLATRYGEIRGLLLTPIPAYRFAHAGYDLSAHDGELNSRRKCRSEACGHIHECEISLRKCVLFDSTAGGRELSGKSVAAGRSRAGAAPGGDNRCSA
jgi:hypothetical protein